jgi:hypothetical protein
VAKTPASSTPLTGATIRLEDVDLVADLDKWERNPWPLLPASATLRQAVAGVWLAYRTLPGLDTALPLVLPVAQWVRFGSADEAAVLAALADMLRPEVRSAVTYLNQLQQSLAESVIRQRAAGQRAAEDRQRAALDAWSNTPAGRAERERACELLRQRMAQYGLENFGAMPFDPNGGL